MDYQSINQMFISSNHPLGCSKDKRPFAGPPTTWKAGKLCSELRHGTGKPMMVLYKDEGDGVVIAGVAVEEC